MNIDVHLEFDSEFFFWKPTGYRLIKVCDGFDGFQFLWLWFGFSVKFVKGRRGK